MVFPGGPDGKESACNSGDWVQSLGQEEPLEEGVATHSSILAWRISGQRRLVGYSPEGHRVMTEATQHTHTHRRKGAEVKKSLGGGAHCHLLFSSVQSLSRVRLSATGF